MVSPGPRRLAAADLTGNRGVALVEVDARPTPQLLVVYENSTPRP